MKCPRRIENPGGVFNLPEDDSTPSLDICTYCGSLLPDRFMSEVEAGTVTLTPTDKDYKVYVEGLGKFTKFYFQHLSEDQKNRFVELLNQKRLKLNVPGHFYVLPFFCVKEPR